MDTIGVTAVGLISLVILTLVLVLVLTVPKEGDRW